MKPDLHAEKAKGVLSKPDCKPADGKSSVSLPQADLASVDTRQPQGAAERPSSRVTDQTPLGSRMTELAQRGQEGMNVLDMLMAANLDTTKKQSLNLFSSTTRSPGGFLAPVTSTEKPGAWERLGAIVDSGASVPVINPKMAKAYPLEESEASKNGVEYEIANGDLLACLGQTRFAVMTQEGTLRGYQSQSADISECLNAVRSMVAGKSAV